MKLSAAQTSNVQVTMSLSSVAAEAVVVAQSETISQTQQNATTLTTDTLGKLPTARNIASAVNLAPGTNSNGPSGNTVISGAMSFENLYLVNGVAIQDNIRNTPYDLFIEDAIQEQTISTSGISAEYGRFAGGVVNVITKSGGNTFSGSFRTSFTNDKWTARTDYVNSAGVNPEVKVDKIIPAYEATIGGPDPQGHPLVLRRRPPAELRGQREHRRPRQRALRHRDGPEALRGQAHLLARRQAHPPRELPEDRPDRQQQLVRHDLRPREPLHPRDSRRS